MKFEPLGEAEPELLEERFLLGGRFGDAAQADLSSIGGGQDDVGAVWAREHSAFIADRGWALLTPLLDGCGTIAGRRFSKCLSVTHRA